MARRHRQHAGRVRSADARVPFGGVHCAHSSKAAGSPHRCARTSPAKWSEPVIKIGFGFARARSRASATDGVMEIVGQPRTLSGLPAGEAPALQIREMLVRIFANSSG